MEKLLMIGYGKCSTCQKDKKWLDEKGIASMKYTLIKNISGEVSLKMLY